MQTALFKVNPEEIDQNLIDQAAEFLKIGETVAFPTETVYGLGANGLNPVAVRKIFSAKGRPSDNPLILHVAELEQVEKIVTSIPDLADLLMQRFWPGPLTLVLPKREVVPAEVTAGLETVAVRMPAHPVAQALLRSAGVPVAAPSANLSGKPSPTRAEHVWQDLQGRVAAIVDGGETGVGLESTVLDLSTSEPYLLRPGGVSLEELEELIGEVHLPAEVDKAETPKAPGMKYRHYAPEGLLWIVEMASGYPVPTAEWLRLAQEAIANGQKPFFLLSQETAQQIPEIPCITIRSFGSRQRPEEIAHNLFALLREADKEQATVIYAEAIGKTGIGAAVMNRLGKAAGGRRLIL